MNILLTSVGRRAYMVKYFKDVIGNEGEIHVSNSDSNTVAFKYADKSVITPLIYDEKYIPFLIDYCKNNKIDILLSLFDIDLLVLAKNKQLFAEIGTRVIVSEPELVDICNDKWKTYLFLKENNFNTPKTYLTVQDTLRALNNQEIKYPVVVKPRFGMGSIALSIAEDDMGLLYFFRQNTRIINRSYLRYESSAVSEDQQIIYQECLDGQEYANDIINDLSGNFVNVISKKKLAMRAGETDIAETVCEPAITSELQRLSSLTKHIANMDCDVFLVNGVPYILEMNARFGGGYPFSHMAGCNLPKAIVEWCKGNEVEKDCLEAQSGLLGYKELVVTNV